MKNSLKSVHLVLGVTGGIAAYKSVELLRLLKKQGASVRVIMTRSALNFVGLSTFEALSEQPVCTDLFKKNDAAIRHIDWAQAADAVIVAPATANCLGKLANGIADDALSTFMLAVTSPRILCPSMNTHMYQSAAVQRNLDTLTGDGYLIINPDSGNLACGTTGPGRLPEPPDILDRIQYYLTPKDLAGKRVLVTAGPTRESIDPVRFISNPSSGKMGYAIARAAEHRGGIVTLITGPTNLLEPNGIDVYRTYSAEEMFESVFIHAEQSDIIIKTAAVGDYRPIEFSEHKIKKNADEIVLTLGKTRDILKELGKRKKGQVLVGFAAETRDLNENSEKKLAEKNLDMIAGNLIGPSDSGFDSDTNRVTLFHRDGSNEVLPLMEKEAVAHLILDRVVTLVNG